MSLFILPFNLAKAIILREKVMFPTTRLPNTTEKIRTASLMAGLDAHH